jgi:hypothetical protein
MRRNWRGFAWLLRQCAAVDAADNLEPGWAQGSPGACAVNAHRLTLAAVASLGLAACSGPQVRTLGNGGGASAYELRGENMAALQAEAARLCGNGYEVLRSAQNFARPEGDGSAGMLWLQHAGDWLSGMPGNQAQATVMCRG